MRTIRFASLIITAPLFLSACASMTPEECATADWQQIGYTDAAKGEHNSKLDDHRQACAETGVTPDMDAYLAGYERGLPAYCTKQSGFDVGSNGGAAPSQCDLDRYPAFADAYDKGIEKYMLSQSVFRVSEDLAQTDQVIEDLALQIATLTDALTQPGLSRDEEAAKESQLRSFKKLLAEQQIIREEIAADIEDMRAQINAIHP